MALLPGKLQKLAAWRCDHRLIHGPTRMSRGSDEGCEAQTWL